MKAYITVFIILFSLLSSFAQQNINYKAIIKDDSGNVIANDLIVVQFIIQQGAAQTNVYQESHTVTTDANGLIIVNIGEGTTSNVFADIDWASDDHFLNVQVNTGDGLTDLGTTQFMHVPYAIQAEKAANVTGLEAIDEGNGNGWRLIDSNPDNFGSIGEYAIDLSRQPIESNVRGATGRSSVAFGVSSEASGSYSFSTGQFNIASGTSSTAFGASNDANGNFSTAFGLNNNADAFGSFAIGRYNMGGGNPTEWSISDAVFEIGRGTSNIDRINALTVFKTGRMRLNSFTNGLEIINGSGFGIHVSGGSSVGFYVNNASVYGGLFRGDDAGLYTRSSNSQNPDIILGGDSNANAEDDAIISSDPQYGSSDFYIRSYDGVIVELDYNDNESGSFIVRNGDGNEVFSVSEGGAIRQNGATIHASDKRLKKDIETLAYGLNEVMQLQPKAYNWKDREQTYKSLGLIAQEVQPIIKEIVTAKDNADKTLGISYSELIPVLIKAIQEQQSIIETLNTDNCHQKSQLKSIEQNYQALLSRIELIESKSSN
ncbi:tail fiber domain-containing protein [Xanthomarina sp. GH4-25]|uniref:tail fiber domain-containing protein n=1 Tax=Xanthomarina sp. GH4-25 TaxID=3349335 RepID=UPI003877DA54